MPYGSGTPCKSHGYPNLEPCAICAQQENMALRELVVSLRDDMRQILNISSSNGHGPLSLDSVRIIAESSLKR